jgi:DNA-directed RNA polymerase specialized sigma24 family protein
MVDWESPSAKLALAEMQKKDVADHVYRFAVWRCGSQVDADDLVADALAIVCDPRKKPWDPAKRRFTTHMRFVIQDLVIDRARSGYARFEVVDSQAAVPSETDDDEPRPLPDGQLHDARALHVQRELGRRLLERLGDRHPLATRLFHAASDGGETPTEQAEELGCTVREVEAAMKVLKYHGGQIKAEYEEGERKRMNELRAAATTEKAVTR